ncbi:hypothetical protein CEXT_640031 [Caerostris extrusa]|uniref:Uncharacterized protein n=1 Tax=Caerostris extrusa TaxID=172846 RepID=A0AAV4PN09_CAEEX|nr:hypothetical protein CEXT_640031 [Caerostris extrusa]
MEWSKIVLSVCNIPKRYYQLLKIHVIPMVKHYLKYLDLLFLFMLWTSLSKKITPSLGGMARCISSSRDIKARMESGYVVCSHRDIENSIKYFIIRWRALSQYNV